METEQPLTITPEDREAAADIWRDYVARRGDVIVERGMRYGNLDDSILVQAFARHRELGTKQERKRAGLSGDSYRMLCNLLAVIHRDGGQYVGDNGLEKAWADAMQLSSERIHASAQPDTSAAATPPATA